MKIRALIVALTAATLLAAPATVAAKLPKFPSKELVPGKSFAGLKLGQSVKAAKKAWGTNKQCSFTKDTASCAWDHGKNGFVQWSAYDGKVVSIRANLGAAGSKPFFGGPLLKIKSSKKVGLGSTFKKWKKAYPQAYSDDGGSLGIGRAGKPFTSITFTGSGRANSIELRRAS